MARIRYLKPEFFEDTKLTTISRDARFLYAGMWCFMDRNGLCEDDVRLIKRNVFPYDEDLTFKKMEALIGSLIQVGALVRLEYEGRKYLYCPTLKKHQLFHCNEKPKFSIPEAFLKTKIPLGMGNGEWVMGNCVPVLSTVLSTVQAPEHSNNNNLAGIESLLQEFSGPPLNLKTKLIRSPNERKRLVQRLSEVPDLGRWRSALQRASTNPFLSGKTPPKPGRPPFRMTDSWFIQNLENIETGYYDNHPEKITVDL